MLLQGDRDRALECSREALTATRAAGRPYMLAVVLHHQNVFSQLLGDRQAVEERTAELLLLARGARVCPLACHGDAAARLGRGASRRAGRGHRHDAGRARRQAGDRLADQDSVLSRPHGQSAVRAGHGLEALPLLEDAFTQIAVTGERWFEAELHRIRGEALLAIAPTNLAEASTCFATAAEVARGQQAAWWEASVARSLASAAAEHQARRSRARVWSR